MAQQFFSSATNPSTSQLDANFTELYDRPNTSGASGVTQYARPFVSPASVSTGAMAGGLELVWGSVAGGIRATHGGDAANMGLALTTGNSGTAHYAVLVADPVGNFNPTTDGARTFGKAAYRWSQFYAATGTINTSDAREKTAVEPLTAAELAASKDLARAIGGYQWLASVQEKGADARTHIGLTVQRAIEILASHGLDPLRYGFICHDTWAAQPDPNDASVVTPAGDRYGFRTGELLMFIARGLEARITALEG